VIPTTIASPTTSTVSPSNQYLILNSEFRISQYITGFQLYGRTAGLITIQVRIVEYL
jgi:hypothetical protein